MTSKEKKLIEEAINILSAYRIDSKESMGWAIQRGISFLETNFNIKEKWNEVSNS
tara:strand:- start:1447 stop:1611 length:165 start_codon:yes stop_codon:yes gene_type:complete